MLKYLLRIEGVNLSYFVYDTNKIQPTRGGSFLLLSAIDSLIGNNFDGVILEPIAVGASIGLFSFKVNNSAEAQEVCAKVKEHLLKHTGNHATFVVDCVEESGNFNRDLIKVQALNRWRQYQEPSFSLPNKGSNGQCAYDGVRPAKNILYGKPVSESVEFRTTEGRNLRQDLYGKILGQNSNEFTDDLHELSYDPDKGNLNNKIAFIYIDGNRFTKVRNTLCNSEDLLKQFSQKVKDEHAKFLKNVFISLGKDFKTSSGKIRLETLLWGGDEIELVVPAWKGFKVLKIFYDTIKDLVFSSGSKDVQLTYSAGIVFCSCKAPIREIRRLVRELAGLVKSEIPEDISLLNHDEHDAFRFLVLESFGIIGYRLDTFLNKYYPSIWPGMGLKAGQMDGLRDAISEMKKYGFPRNKLFDIVKLLRMGRAGDIATIVEKALGDSPRASSIVKKINSFVDGVGARWQVICDLWDYVN